MDDTPFDYDVAAATHDIITHGYLHMLAISILYYDHLITAGLEVRYLWGRPKSQSSYWFFLNRYFAFLANISVTALGFSKLSDESCKKYNLYRQILLIVNQILVCVLLTVRIFALYQRSKRILAWMLGSGAVLAGTACFVMFGQKSAPAGHGPGCHVGLSKETAIRLAGAWEALFVYDSIIFFLTVWKTMKEKKDQRVTGINVTLIDVLLRDGAVYFAVMALCNLTNILTFYLAGPFLRGGLSTFASSMSVTMMSRLMLNLHETAQEGIYTTQATNTDFRATRFRGAESTIELDTLPSIGVAHASNIGQSRTEGETSSGAIPAAGSATRRRASRGHFDLEALG